MKKIVYVGIERCDIVYHLATILSLQVEKVVVVDSSLSQDLMKTITGENDSCLYEWRNIIFVRNVNIEGSEELRSADVIIEYAGLNRQYEFKNIRITEDPITWLVMPDYTRFCLDIVEAMTVNDGDEVIYIPRDFCSKKITDKSLAVLLNISPNKIAGHIPFNVEDLAAYVALTHNGHQNIKGVSETTMEVLTYITGNILEESDPRKLKKIIAGAKKIK